MSQPVKIKHIIELINYRQIMKLNNKYFKMLKIIIYSG